MMSPILKHLGSFWPAGFWILLFIVIVGVVFNISGLHFDVIIAVIIAVALWVALLLSIRRYVIYNDLKILKNLLNRFRVIENEEMQSEKSVEILETKPGNPYPQFWARFGIDNRKLNEFIKKSKSNKVILEMFGELVNDVDQAISSWYIAIQALVWSLPALGFLGTAWHMREAILTFINRGLTENTLDTTQILSEIAPALTISFLIICFALGLTVITYIATALTLKSDTEASQQLKEILRTIVFQQSEVENI